MVGLWMACAFAAFGQVLTEHNDLSRSGANTSETVLTYSNVNSSTFGKLFTDSVDGNIVGQPLYVPRIQFLDGSTHNVVYVATQHDSVYAFDADSPQPALWQASFINPGAGITSVPISDYGCASTAFTEVAGYEKDGWAFIHPFDDSLVMAGQGTVGLEILDDVPQVTDVIVSIGGGGLMSGVATAIKTLKPAVRIWGVETEGADCMAKSLAAGKIVTLDAF